MTMSCPGEIACEYEALSPDEKGLGPQDLTFEFSTTFNQQTDLETETIVSQEWVARITQNRFLFNGPKFRCHQVAWVDSRPVVRLGLTTYRDYIGTNCNVAKRELLRAKGMKLNGDPQAFMADPLGVGTVLVSADDQLILLRRSSACSEAQGLLDGPGGHAEPEMIPELMKDVKKPIPSQVLAKEVFESIIREVVDEANLDMATLSEPRLMGFTKNNTTGGRKSFEFLIRCNLTASEIVKCFNRGTQTEAYESTGILTVALQDVPRALSPVPPGGDDGLGNELAPAARARLQLFQFLKNKPNSSNCVSI